MKNIYKICCESDYEKVAIATLKKVYSTTLFPRVLSNTQNSVLSKNFKKFTDFECFLTQNSRFFAKKVHFDCFDIGLFFFKMQDKLCLKLFDGNGLIASNFVTNIFDFVFSLDKDNFKNYKNQVYSDYKVLNKTKLIFQDQPI